MFTKPGRAKAGSAQGQAGRASEQPDLVEDIPAVLLDGLQRSLPTQNHSKIL